MNNWVLEELLRIYYEEENWHTIKLTPELAEKYHRTLLGLERLLYYSSGNKIYGYVESWLINYTQLGRIVCKDYFDPCAENTTSGNICYVANVWVDKCPQKENIKKILKLRFFKQNYMCEYIVGDKINKKCQPIKVFKKQEYYDKFIGRK